MSFVLAKLFAMTHTHTQTLMYALCQAAIMCKQTRAMKEYDDEMGSVFHRDCKSLKKTRSTNGDVRVVYGKCDYD